MVGRRHSSSKSSRERARAHDGPRASVDRNAERLAVVEATCSEMKRKLASQTQRMEAIQAQLDHLAAKFGGR